MERSNTDLLENENVLYHARLHWALFLGPAMLLLLGGLSVSSKGLAAAVMSGLGLLWGMLSYKTFCSSSIRLTNKRILVRVGTVIRKIYAVPLTDVTLVDLHQPSLGVILNFGNVTIIYGGKFKSSFKMVASPAEFVTKVRDQVTITRGNTPPTG
ncbi:MAG: hypothetical protein A4E65_02173 [Syntrophorhabdus sp. PtaU1.Bin153]|nr:MAG: hypothetical protein A4E65_02173 [Syntrophorhabdus sp. PtaU1.Bin153]